MKVLVPCGSHEVSLPPDFHLGNFYSSSEGPGCTLGFFEHVLEPTPSPHPLPPFRVNVFEISLEPCADDDTIEAALAELNPGYHFRPEQVAHLFAFLFKSKRRLSQSVIGYLNEQVVSLSFWHRWSADTNQRVPGTGILRHVGRNRLWNAGTLVFAPVT
ncbi:hypothetical protein K2Q16_01330 [Patescibacteria group bacterium]|nr:hypothetical protein [Patescibacteria group bacterium]